MTEWLIVLPLPPSNYDPDGSPPLHCLGGLGIGVHEMAGQPYSLVCTLHYTTIHYPVLHPKMEVSYETSSHIFSK